MSHAFDSKALELSRKTMGLMYGPMPVGGSCQLQAQIQNMFIEAMEFAAPAVQAGQEPIYQLRDVDWYDTDKRTYDTVVNTGGAGRIVYAAPQLPQPAVVPDAIEIDDDFDSAFEHGKAVGWNACRAAMLNGGKS